MKALLVPADAGKAISLVEWHTLEDLQALVGGYIQSIPFREDVAPYFNEDGRAMRLPFNERASRLLNVEIVGDCLFVGFTDEGEEIDPPQEFVQELTEWSER